MKTIFKIVAGIIIAAVVLVIIVVVLIGQGVDSAQKDSDKHAITKQQFKSVKIGTSKSDVMDSLGKPSDKQHTKAKGLGSQDCIYYNIKGDMLSSYQFCFSNNKLDSKSKY